jgi:hypothetical protein
LGHARDHGIEKPSGRGGSVDGLLERNQVGVVLAENVGEFEQFFGISGKPGKL